jgi:hypothetical protein
MIVVVSFAGIAASSILPIFLERVIQKDENASQEWLAFKLRLGATYDGIYQSAKNYVDCSCPSGSSTDCSDELINLKQAGDILASKEISIKIEANNLRPDFPFDRTYEDIEYILDKISGGVGTFQNLSCFQAPDLLDQLEAVMISGTAIVRPN